jgi:hypothetical protein
MGSNNMAIEAVRYLLARTVFDVNFRYHFLDTESLDRCLEAEAESRGVRRDDIEMELVTPPSSNAPSALGRQYRQPDQWKEIS